TPAAAPSAPSTPVLSPASDDGVSSSDHITSINTLALSGTAQTGILVTLFDGGTSLGSTHANSQGAWSFTTPPLADGTLSLPARATDSLGNVSASSGVLSVTVDHTGQLANPLHSLTGQVALQTKPLGKPHGNSSQQTVSVVNNSGQAIHGPIYLVLDGLKKRVKLRNASGRTASGSLFVKLDPGQFLPGATIRFTLSFSGGPARYRARVVAGFGTL